MPRPEDRFEMPIRLLAAGATLLSLAMLHAGTAAEAAATPAGVAMLIFSACAGFTLVVRGLGPGIAAGLGVVIAVSLGIAVGDMTGAGPFGNAAFIVLTSSLLLCVGRIAGAQSQRIGPLGIREDDAAPVSGFQPHRGTSVWAPPRDTLTVEQLLGRLVGDFCAWTRTSMAENYGGHRAWSAFARFVRQALEDRVGAQCVEILRRDPDGAWSAMGVDARDRQQLADDASALHAAQTGHVYIASPSEGARNAGDWSWLLPIHRNGAVEAIIAVRGFRAASHARPSIGHAVRDLIEMLWLHMHGRVALERQARSTHANTPT